MTLRERKFAGFGRALVVVAILGAVLALPRTGATFVATTDNINNDVIADTLDPPTGLLASDGVSITLDWTATVDSYATGYRVFRSATTGGPYTQIAEIPDTSVVTYIDTPPEGTYHYVVRTHHLSWDSADSTEEAGRKWRPFDCPADPDLRACVRFDEDLAGTYADESGYGNTVTHTGGSLVPGISGDAADGVPGSRYEIADSTSLDISDTLTVEVWVRFDSVPSSGRAGIIDNDGQFSLIYYAGSGLQCDLDATLPAVPIPVVGDWFHVACTWDGATLTMYFDGVEVATMPSTGMIDTTNTDPVSLLNTSPLFAEPTDGAIDNLRIWHAARTQAQICADAGLTGC